jgi:hypothetical protein
MSACCAKAGADKPAPVTTAAVKSASPFLVIMGFLTLGDGRPLRIDVNTMAEA